MSVSSSTPADNNGNGVKFMGNSSITNKGNIKKGSRFKSSRRRREKVANEFMEELLQVDRVVRVVKGGRRLRFRVTVIVGNKNGKVGVGLGKATEVPQAIKKAVASAKKSLISVPIKNGTIEYEVDAKFKASKVNIRPAKVGSGIVLGSSMRKIANLAGIEDIIGKSHGSNNRINMARAMILALSSLK